MQFPVSCPCNMASLFLKASGKKKAFWKLYFGHQNWICEFFLWILQYNLWDRELLFNPGVIQGFCIFSNCSRIQEQNILYLCKPWVSRWLRRNHRRRTDTPPHPLAATRGSSASGSSPWPGGWAGNLIKKFKREYTKLSRMIRIARSHILEQSFV